MHPAASQKSKGSAVKLGRGFEHQEKNEVRNISELREPKEVHRMVTKYA